MFLLACNYCLLTFAIGMFADMMGESFLNE